MVNTTAVPKVDTIGTDLVKICHVFLMTTFYRVSCLAQRIGRCPFFIPSSYFISPSLYLLTPSWYLNTPSWFLIPPHLLSITYDRLASFPHSLLIVLWNLNFLICIWYQFHAIQVIEWCPLLILSSCLITFSSYLLTPSSYLIYPSS